MTAGRQFLAGVAVALCACGNVNTQAPDNNAAPTANADATIETISLIPTEFDGSSSSDADGFIVAWIWDFGDGETATGEVVYHVYEAAGAYPASLTVRDNQQKEAVASVAVTVEALTGLQGDWTVTADPATTVCDNTHASYAVPFPAPVFSISVSGDTISGVAGLTGVSFSGTFESDGILTLDATTDDPGATCGSGNPVGRSTVEQFQLTFADAQNFSGLYVFQVTASDPFCNCAKIFDVTGSR